MFINNGMASYQFGPGAVAAYLIKTVIGPKLTRRVSV